MSSAERIAVALAAGDLVILVAHPHSQDSALHTILRAAPFVGVKTDGWHIRYSRPAQVRTPSGGQLDLCWGEDSLRGRVADLVFTPPGYPRTTSLGLVAARSRYSLEGSDEQPIQSYA